MSRVKDLLISSTHELTCLHTACRSFQPRTKKSDVLDDSLSSLIGAIFIYSFNTYLMSTYYLPDTILGARDIAVTKTRKDSYPRGVRILMRLDNKQDK